MVKTDSVGVFANGQIGVGIELLAFPCGEDEAGAGGPAVDPLSIAALEEALG